MSSSDERKMDSTSAPQESVSMDITNESVHTSDDVDIGAIDAINRNFIVVRRGLIHVHYYYIPIQHVEGWDEHAVWLKIPEEQVKQNFERGVEPNPAVFYVQGTSYEQSRPYLDDDLPEIPVIEPKHRRTLHSKPIENTRLEQAPGEEETTTSSRGFAAGSSIEHDFECPLCAADFASKDELSAHVTASH